MSIKSAIAIKMESGRAIRETRWARFDLIMSLLEPPIVDEDGNRIGTAEPLITKEDALALLYGKDLQ